MKNHGFLACLLCLIIFSCSQKNQTENTQTEQANPTELETQAKVKDSIPLAKEDIGRTEWQNPELVLSSLGDLTGKTVADIGAGSGYFSFKMAQSAAKVLALEIDQNALDYIDNQIEIVGEWAKKVETRLTPANEPNLAFEEADAVLIVNTYFYIPERPNYLKKLFESIKENGRFVIVDYKIGNTPVGPSDDFKVQPEVVERELREAGFKSVSVDLQSLQYQFVISAEKR